MYNSTNPSASVVAIYPSQFPHHQPPTTHHHQQGQSVLYYASVPTAPTSQQHYVPSQPQLVPFYHPQPAASAFYMTHSQPPVQPQQQQICFTTSNPAVPQSAVFQSPQPVVMHQQSVVRMIAVPRAAQPSPISHPPAPPPSTVPPQPPPLKETPPLVTVTKNSPGTVERIMAEAGFECYSEEADKYLEKLVRELVSIRQMAEKEKLVKLEKTAPPILESESPIYSDKKKIPGKHTKPIPAKNSNLEYRLVVKRETAKQSDPIEEPESIEQAKMPQQTEGVRRGRKPKVFASVQEADSEQPATYSPEQLQVLNQEFAAHRFPSLEKQQQLARRLNLKPHVVNSWFISTRFASLCANMDQSSSKEKHDAAGVSPGNSFTSCKDSEYIRHGLGKGFDKDSSYFIN